MHTFPMVMELVYQFHEPLEFHGDLCLLHVLLAQGREGDL